MVYTINRVTDDTLNLYLEKYRSNKVLNEEEITQCLSVFESYECWTPFFNLLEKQLEKPKSTRFKYYIKYIAAKNIFLDNFADTLEMCKKMLQDLKLNFKDFSKEVIPQILSEHDYVTEANLLENIYAEFSETKDKVFCLERLALLYDKKLFYDEKLEHLYTLIIELDSNNIKALNFFKAIYIESENWETVSDTLNKLLKVVDDKEKYRIAQELAGVYVYYTGQSQLAIDVLEKYNSQNPLDSNEILFDAYEKIGDMQGCIKVLNSYAKSVHDNKIKATIQYRKGQIYDRIQNVNKAVQCFQKSSQLWPEFLEPIEELIRISVQNDDWQKVVERLTHLSGILNMNRQKKMIEDLIDRVKGCIQNDGR